MTSPTRHTDRLVLQDHDGINMKDEYTHVTSKKVFLPTEVPSPTCVSSMSSSSTIKTKRTTTDEDALFSPLRLTTIGFAKTDNDSGTTKANKKQCLEAKQFSWFNKPTHQEIKKIIFSNEEVPKQEERTVCKKTTMSLDLPQELNLPAFLLMSSSETGKDDHQELQSSARDRRIRPKSLYPAICQMKKHKGFHHKTTKAIQPCLFDPDEFSQVSSSSRSRRSSHRREVSLLTNETQTSLLMVPSFESTY